MSITFEQIVCWLIGLALLVAAFRYLVKEKLSFSFLLCLCSIGFFFFGLSGVQGLLKTGLLLTVKDSLVKYGEKLDTFQTNVAAMRTELAEQQQAILKAQAEIATQQAIITNQSQKVASVQNELVLAQKAVTAIAAQVETQQAEINHHQDGLAKQQTNIEIQETTLTNQFRQMVEMQGQLAVAQTNLTAQQQKIEDIESLFGNLYARMTEEEFEVTDTNRVFVIPYSDGDVGYFFKLQSSAMTNSVTASAVTRIGYRYLISIKGRWPVSLQSDRNIAYASFAGRLTKDSRFYIQYVRNMNTNQLVRTVSQNGDITCFDGMPALSKHFNIH